MNGEDLTKQVLIEMLKENTGANFLDSGSAYGRNWERNQSTDFDDKDPVTVEFYCMKPCSRSPYSPGVTVEDLESDKNKPCSLDITATIDVYHWLLERVEYDPKMDEEFNKFLDDREDTYWLQDMEEFPQYWGKKHGKKVTGLYRGGEYTTCNTYNGDCALSQTLQFTLFESEDNAWVLLQIHGGCDVRGGYTKPRVFKVGDDPGNMFMFNDMSIYPEGRADDVRWWTDDGYNWYLEVGDDNIDDKNLEDYECSEDPNDKGKGKVYVDKDGNGYCPITSEKLEAYF